ncbi:hypothetical protein HHI36_015466 [Cryptolaemus montrouzieri]|uniref:Uncharacterized protein n=1 Tax=Cryptolaemus montrouzieri TaxID=559131 RepID=A0ABD2N6J2_9CUCU
MEIEQDDRFIKVYAHLHIIENDKFEVIKRTAVPMKKQNSIQVLTPSLDVNYNTQKYFEISNDQVFQAISIGQNTYIYDPTIIKSMDKNPNCIIDQIYRRVDEPVCRNTLSTAKTMEGNPQTKHLAFHCKRAIQSSYNMREQTARSHSEQYWNPSRRSTLYHKNETKYAAIQGNRNVLSHWNL